MKRSRRVVLTMMGTATIAAVSMGFSRKRSCGPGLEAVPGSHGRLQCRAIHGGFGHAVHRFHGHGTHSHGSHGHGSHGHAGG
ncbi:hypothetical protein; putative signal peptide [Bradyrhizobium sp. ORS 278]|uniref:hypothetical protein n=1 Tax=Bradyrhizobium sp. (strain ORS 278) TaxID=114615 RepID=UPI0001507A48|nr:hypothetical protein [Bradyrhizobium sp. ORS 278]CAL75374.1 hypothetical protein; putative signal peptide [Bradyrhizobium sp. ORS 278]